MATQAVTPDDESVILQLSEPPPDASSLERRVADALRKGLSYYIPPDANVGPSHTASTVQDDVDTEIGDSTLYDGASIRSDTTLDMSLSDMLEKAVSPSDGSFVSHSRSSAGGDRILPYNGKYVSLGALNESLLKTNDVLQANSSHTYKLLLNATARDSRYLDGHATVEFKVEIDTGSNDSWLYDPGLLELEVKKSGDPPKITYTLDTFKIQLPRNKVYAHGYGPDTLPAQKTYDTPLPPRVKYVDHTEGLVTMASAPMDLELQNCYKWGQVIQRANISMRYHFEIMYACTNGLAILEDFDGLLGFGTEDYQSAFEPNYPSFTNVLRSQLIRPSNGDGGIILYFVLRYIIKERRQGRRPRMWPSYLILNQWPGRWPYPSFKRVDVYATATRPGNWLVKLRRIRIMQVTGWDADHVPVPAHCTVRENGVIELNDQLFVLDTGTSLSYFPADAAQYLSHTTFTNIRDGVNNNLAPFFVTANESVEENQWTEYTIIEYDFVNKSDKVVTVRGPARGFLTNEVGAGLIWPTLPRSPNILGLSFYHTMFVANHLPETRDPYVELAPQWPTIHQKCTLPGDT